MIYFCSDLLAKYVILNKDKFNSSIRTLMSRKNVGLPVDNMILPPEEIMYQLVSGNDTNFYYSYMSYLLSYDKAIYALMDILLGDYYSGDTVILTDMDSYIASSIVNGITGAIKERYGYSCVFVKELDDFKDDVFRQTSIPQEYLPIFEMDKDRYTRDLLDNDEVCNALLCDKSIDDFEAMSNGQFVGK